MRSSCLAKKGVSLVTVLIFMMIATIAATATYKWLSSAGFTSADRMAMSEAKEASHAGLESVRSWMTYHANDVGAILRQYYDGGKKPVALTSVVRSMNTGKQVFNVWLTGVETSGSAYKFTIVSNGIARGNAKYSETSILNVRGLYKVKEPSVTISKPLDYHQSYFGGSLKGAGKHTNSSMIINGSWEGNPTGVTEDFVVTGAAELDGKNVKLGKHACIGGDFKSKNEGATGGDLYVKGATTDISIQALSGNAVFNGDVTSTTAGTGLHVDGDLTFRRNYTTERTKPTIVKGNMCLEANGKLHIGDLYQDFSVSKNLVAKTSQFLADKLNETAFGKVKLGGSGFSAYMPNLTACTGDNTPLTGCKSGSLYQEYKKFFQSDASVAHAPTSSMLCDTSIAVYCNNILGPPRTGCKDKYGHNTSYKIDDMLTTAYDSFKQLVDNVPCATIKDNTKDYDMSNLNRCYETTSATPRMMYHGYLVVGVHKVDGGHSIFSSPKDTLDGNFIFVIENKFDMLKFPPTKANANVFVYLANGAKQILTPDADPNDHTHYNYNYFFYSKGDIDELQHKTESLTWNGSFYLTAENCSRIKLLNTKDMKMVLNETLLKNLTDSSVICGISELGNCGSLVGDGESTIDQGGEEMNTDAGYDKFYIATAPQLSITLESQRRNKEILYDNLTSSEYTTVSPSIIILPRIAYLSDTPEGKLTDYFKLVPLNGARATYSASNTSCTPGLSTGENARLYTNTPLSSPVYKCEYTHNTYGKIPFWLVVDAEAAQKSAVSFVGTESRIFGGGSVTVKMSVDGSQSNDVTALVRVTDVPQGWTVHPSGDYVAAGASEANGMQYYTVTLPAGMETPVFQVEADGSAENDQINFTIMSVSENARMGDNPSHSVWLNVAATVKREDIPSTGYCDNDKHKTINGVSCLSVVDASRPNCEGNLVMSALGEWVSPNCPDITTQTPNEQWGCGLTAAEGVKLLPRSVSPYCDVFIPDSTLTSLEDAHTYTLYASYKAKLFTLKIYLDGSVSSKVNVKYSKDIIDKSTNATTQVCETGDTCRVNIYAGYHVELRPDTSVGEKFISWNFMRSDGTVDVTQPFPRTVFTMQNDTTVVAKFNQLENHCFYKDFKDVKIWCDNSSQKACIDKCTNAKKNSSCETSDGGSYTNSDWLVPRTNNGNNYSKPQKENDKFIYYSAKGNSSNNNSTITYLLNRTQAGGHGTLTSRFKTCYFNTAPNNSFLNSGFMLRSSQDASSYNIIQIYGRASTQYPGFYAFDARVCKGNGTGINNTNSGNCQTKTFQTLYVNLYDIERVVFNTDIKVSGDNAIVELSYKKDGSWTRSTVTLPLSVSANIDEYVGLSMADNCFKVMNLGWESDDWDKEKCFDIPEVGCSFAANYLGGILPLNEDVKPWVGTSSYFNDPNNPDKLRPGCTLSYHYNGCDLASNYATNRCEKWQDGTTHCSSCNADSDGPYYVSGAAANTMKDEKYKFTYAGLHGTSKTYEYNGTTIYGAVRDASIVVDCSGETGNGRIYEATCGRFVVGSINECSQGTSFSLDNCSGGKSCLANVSGGIANLRSSILMGEISGLPESDGSGSIPTVTMVMNDANGLQSQEYRITGNGPFSRDVDLMADMQEFDPEKVVSVEFTSAENFTISSLTSSCPNSVGVSTCEAEFQGDRFVVTSSIVNASGATCKASDALDVYKTEEKDCPSDGKFTIPAVDLQKDLNTSGGSRSFTFNVTIKPKDGGEEQTCTTPAVNVLANELTCSLSSEAPINPGDNLPALNYQVSNCPESGCAIEAKVGSEAPVRLTYRGNGQVNSWSPTNVSTTPGNYRYTLSYAGLTCTADITVVTGANGSTADNCAIDEANKRFTADLNLAVGSTNNLKLWYTDKLGHIVGSSKTVSPSTTQFDEPLPAIAEAGDYVIVLSINGEEACSVQYTYTEEEPAEEAQCYIEDGRFKTRNKNTTGNTLYGVALNRNTDGATYGDGVGSTSWPDGGYIDMDAYVPTTPGTYTYNLWYSGNVLCSVTYEVKDETEENP